jgi:hypothetical protein
VMPNFFVPHTSSPQEAEEAYASMRKRNYYGDDTPGRLYRITFQHEDRVFTAQVGSELSDFPDGGGEVLAIIETTNVCTIHTSPSESAPLRPIAVYPRRIKSRQYFDDYPVVAGETVPSDLPN